MADRMSDKQWAEPHKKIAREHLRHQLAAVLDLHVPLADQSGFMSLEEIQCELITAICVVERHKPKVPLT